MSKKITDLTLLNEAPADTDIFEVVDISDTTMGATGTNKKITKANLIADLASKSETLTNKTLTSPVINTQITGTAIVDEDTMSSDSAVKVPTQQSVKAYVDTKASTEKADLTKFSNLYAPEGFLINGVVTPSVGSNNLTVAIKTLAGTDPSATNPVYCRIGGTLRTITSALTGTASAGVGYFNAGSTELATKEIDYFAYLCWDTAESKVYLGWSRIPYATLVSDFNLVDAGNEKGRMRSTGDGFATGTDTVVNIGRFAATMSAVGTGYLFSVPTFTATNLIQRPIYETRWSNWTTSATWTGGAAPTVLLTLYAYTRYKIEGDKARISLSLPYTNAGTTITSVAITIPFQPSNPLGLTGAYDLIPSTMLNGSTLVPSYAQVDTVATKLTIVCASSTVTQARASGPYEI